MRLDTTAAAALIDAQFLELAPARVHLLGEGCDSVAFEVNGTWVFRFPKNADVARQLDFESRMLPMLAAHLSTPIPEFRYRGAPSDIYPYAFAGYPKLPGKPALALPPDVMPIANDALLLVRTATERRGHHGGQTLNFEIHDFSCQLNGILLARKI
ncbi:MAG TPA: phosphotransferase [Vicinamibacterales bacterium]